MEILIDTFFDDEEFEFIEQILEDYDENEYDVEMTKNCQ